MSEPPSLWTNIYPNGDYYTGEVVNGSTKHGMGAYTWHSTGARYHGYWRDNVPHGPGILIMPGETDGYAYAGDFVQGMRHGQGSCIFASGRCYVGGWERDRMHGAGVLHGAPDVDDWVVFDGSLVHGQRECARGECVYAQGDVYVGAWVCDRREGWGVLQRAVCCTSAAVVPAEESAASNASPMRRAKVVYYEGYFAQDEPQGSRPAARSDGRGSADAPDVTCSDTNDAVGTNTPCRMKYDDGSEYSGAAVAMQRHGHGELRWSDGSVYVGSFARDAEEGYGVWCESSYDVKADSHSRPASRRSDSIAAAAAAATTRVSRPDNSVCHGADGRLHETDHTHVHVCRHSSCLSAIQEECCHTATAHVAQSKASQSSEYTARRYRFGGCRTESWWTRYDGMWRMGRFHGIGSGQLCVTTTTSTSTSTNILYDADMPNDSVEAHTVCAVSDERRDKGDHVDVDNNGNNYPRGVCCANVSLCYSRNGRYTGGWWEGLPDTRTATATPPTHSPTLNNGTCTTQDDHIGSNANAAQSAAYPSETKKTTHPLLSNQCSSPKTNDAHEVVHSTENGSPISNHHSYTTAAANSLSDTPTLPPPSRYHGHWQWDDGSVYRGEVAQGLAHGRGHYTHRGGAWDYEGDFMRGMVNGWGRYESTAGHEKGHVRRRYIGPWQEGCACGAVGELWVRQRVVSACAPQEKECVSGQQQQQLPMYVWVCYRGEWKAGYLCGQGEEGWCTEACMTEAWEAAVAAMRVRLGQNMCTGDAKRVLACEEKEKQEENGVCQSGGDGDCGNSMWKAGPAKAHESVCSRRAECDNRPVPPRRAALTDLHRKAAYSSTAAVGEPRNGLGKGVTMIHYRGEYREGMWHGQGIAYYDARPDHSYCDGDTIPIQDNENENVTENNSCRGGDTVHPDKVMVPYLSLASSSYPHKLSCTSPSSSSSCSGTPLLCQEESGSFVEGHLGGGGGRRTLQGGIVLHGNWDMNGALHGPGRIHFAHDTAVLEAVFEHGMLGEQVAVTIRYGNGDVYCGAVWWRPTADMRAALWPTHTRTTDPPPHTCTIDTTCAPTREHADSSVVNQAVTACSDNSATQQTTDHVTASVPNHPHGAVAVIDISDTDTPHASASSTQDKHAESRTNEASHKSRPVHTFPPPPSSHSTTCCLSLMTHGRYPHTDYSLPQRHGAGVYTFAEGHTLSCTWRYNILHGEGVYTHAQSGKSSHRRYVDGVCIQPITHTSSVLSSLLPSTSVQQSSEAERPSHEARITGAPEEEQDMAAQAAGRVVGNDVAKRRVMSGSSSLTMLTRRRARRGGGGGGVVVHHHASREKEEAATAAVTSNSNSKEALVRSDSGGVLCGPTRRSAACRERRTRAADHADNNNEVEGTGAARREAAEHPTAPPMSVSVSNLNKTTRTNTAIQTHSTPPPRRTSTRRGHRYVHDSAHPPLPSDVSGTATRDGKSEEPRRRVKRMTTAAASAADDTRASVPSSSLSSSPSSSVSPRACSPACSAAACASVQTFRHAIVDLRHSPTTPTPPFRGARRNSTRIAEVHSLGRNSGDGDTAEEADAVFAPLDAAVFRPVTRRSEAADNSEEGELMTHACALRSRREDRIHALTEEMRRINEEVWQRRVVESSWQGDPAGVPARVTERLAKLREMRRDTAQRLLRALDAEEPVATGHTMRQQQ